MLRYLHTGEIDGRAASLWDRFSLSPQFNVERLADDLDLGLVWLPLQPQDGMTIAAELRLDPDKICVNEDLLELFESAPALLRFTLAHEIGHAVLHGRALRVRSGVVTTSDGALVCRKADIQPGPTRFMRRLEVQANIFASHLLAPDRVLAYSLAAHGCDGWPPVYRIAVDLGMSPSALVVRLTQDGYAYKDARGVPREGPEPPREQTSFGF